MRSVRPKNVFNELARTPGRYPHGHVSGTSSFTRAVPVGVVVDELIDVSRTAIGKNKERRPVLCGDPKRRFRRRTRHWFSPQRAPFGGVLRRARIVVPPER